MGRRRTQSRQSDYTTLMRLLSLERQCDLREYILRRHREGRTLREIAQDLGISRHALYRWLPRLGLDYVRVEYLRPIEASEGDGLGVIGVRSETLAGA